MGGADPRGAYAIMKWWYLHASARVTDLSQTDMEKVRGAFHTLYQREDTHPPVMPLATHVDPEKVNDKIPSEAEVKAAVQRPCPHRAGRHTHLHVEHFKQWRREAYTR